MSWLSDFLGGGKKLRIPEVKPTEMEPDEYGFGIDAYLKALERKSGFEDTIITGSKKKPKLGADSYLGAT